MLRLILVGLAMTGAVAFFAMGREPLVQSEATPTPTPGLVIRIVPEPFPTPELEPELTPVPGLSRPAQHARAIEHWAKIFTNEERLAAGKKELLETSHARVYARRVSATQFGGGLTHSYGGLRGHSCAENLASYPRGGRSDKELARAIVTAWMESEGHRENMLGDFYSFGIGVEVQKDVAIATQLFCN